jgi:tRNA-specific 2-thiouridylase
MRNWDTHDESGTDRGCEWEKDWEDVQRVCKVLDIPCKMVRWLLQVGSAVSLIFRNFFGQVDLSREYWTRVFEPSLRVWESGGTPNPDIWCNRCVYFVNYVRLIHNAKPRTSI